MLTQLESERILDSLYYHNTMKVQLWSVLDQVSVLVSTIARSDTCRYHGTIEISKFVCNSMDSQNQEVIKTSTISSDAIVWYTLF